MATVNLGSIRFNWKGAYNNSTAYVVNDVVTSSGNSYVCIQASQGNAVGNATAYWNIMSSAGTNGTNGTDLTSTLTTQGDIVYRGSSGLARLGYGTSGQFLKTQGSGANPVWGDIAGGAVKNVYLFQEKNTYDFANTTTKIVTSSSISPVSTASRFIIQGQAHGATQDDGGAPVLEVSSDNGSSYSTLHEGNSSGSRTRSGGGAGFWRGDGDNAIEFQAWGIWHPNTTNNVKFALAIRATSNSVKINRTHNDNNTAHAGYRGILSLLVTEVDGSATSTAPSVIQV